MSLYSKFLGFAIRWDQDWETLRAEGDETALQGAREIENVLGERSRAIVYHIERALRDARCPNLTGDRTIKHSAIRLKKDASEALEIYMGTSLIADIMYDPKDFYELPMISR